MKICSAELHSEHPGVIFGTLLLVLRQNTSVESEVAKKIEYILDSWWQYHLCSVSNKASPSKDWFFCFLKQLCVSLSARIWRMMRTPKLHELFQNWHLKKTCIVSEQLHHYPKLSKIMPKSISVSDNSACPCSLSSSPSLHLHQCPQAFPYFKCKFCFKFPEQGNKQKTDSKLIPVVWNVFLVWAETLFKMGVYQFVSVTSEHYYHCSDCCSRFELQFGLQSKYRAG